MTDDQLRPDLASAGSGAPDLPRGASDPSRGVAGRDPDRVGATGGDPGGAGRVPTAGGRASEQGAAALNALHRLAEGEDERSALGDLALADVLLPDLGNEIADLSEESEVLQLPVAERQDGTQFVPTFTSEQRLTEALPDVARYRTVQIATLGRIWPSDDLLLAVDPGSETGIALPAEGLRALAAMSA
ncbi:SseB protein N-terminal domain [Frankia torreyi]|uniref:SseB protein N-terminal domain n=2 Tax=Frankia TaxID=1854 RepID=A0A0D8B9M6_9ACTN|nr:SseB family protein [Frankia torreyi]KJE20978.1 SseB protein N-terminal domain [Frankia torreyi]KQM03848.1 SseB protein N-terminal domain [Frankia sp. CpI1-P]